MSANNRRASRKARSQRQKNENSLKVVYISNPMKVKTSADRFRSLVQELTGKNSDVSRIMDHSHNHNNNNTGEGFQEIDCYGNNNVSEQHYQSLSSEDATTAGAISSSSFLGNIIDNNIAEQQLIFNDPFDQLGVLGSYEGLL